MGKLKNWLWIILFGSLWGMIEVVGGDTIFENNVPYASVLLAVCAFFILAAARGVLNRPGSSILIGGIASFFKLANAAPFYCHLLGIFMVGLAFDIFSTLFMKNERKVSLRSSLTGMLSAYGSNTLFALVITYIVRYEYWVAGGFSKVLDHIFISGSFAALLAAMLVPLGFWIGAGGRILAERRPQWIYTGTLTGIVIIWSLARIIG